MSKTLRMSSIPNEYYLGDLPGSLQYAKEQKEILDCLSCENPDACGYNLCDDAEIAENYNRVIPNTKTGTHGEWKILVLMKAEKDGVVWLKAAMLNKKTSKIGLMTGANNSERLNRPINAVEDGWFVGHYRMSAPIVFWGELVKQLKTL